MSGQTKTLQAQILSRSQRNVWSDQDTLGLDLKQESTVMSGQTKTLQVWI